MATDWGLVGIVLFIWGLGVAYGLYLGARTWRDTSSG